MWLLVILVGLRDDQPLLVVIALENVSTVLVAETRQWKIQSFVGNINEIFIQQKISGDFFFSNIIDILSIFTLYRKYTIWFHDLDSRECVQLLYEMRFTSKTR